MLVATSDVRDPLGHQRFGMDREQTCTVDLRFCGPEEIRTPDLTRASRANVISGYSQAFTFSTISAGQRAIAAHAYSHLLSPVSDGDVGDLLGAGAPSESR